MRWFFSSMAVAAICAFALFRGQPQSAVSSAGPAERPLPPIVEPSRGIPIKASSTPAGARDLQALGEMGNVCRLLRDYQFRLGEFPIGSNQEITAALMGANASKIRFLERGELALNDRLELVDHWGRPYFFHQESAQKMELRSAGPDREMWTTDDLTLLPK